MEIPPTVGWGVFRKGCSAVSYFSTRRGSIIGADRLSFRVRDGSGRFPVAMTAVTLFSCGGGSVVSAIGVAHCVVRPALWSAVFLVPRYLSHKESVFLVVGCNIWYCGIVVA